MQRWNSRQIRGSGFTLVEILIVVVILGILAAIVVVSVSSLGKEAREATLRHELQFMRTQIAVYAGTHANAPGLDPATRAPVPGLFEEQLTHYTDYNGNLGTNDGAHPFAPYISEMPSNPVAGKSTIKLVLSGALAAAVDDTTGWLYKPETLEFCANSSEYGPGDKNW